MKPPPPETGRSLRIALVHPYPWPEVRRGAERYLDDLSGYLADEGHDVTIVTGTTETPVQQPSPRNLTMVRLPRPHLRGARHLGLGEMELFGLSALPWLRASTVDLVHALVPSGALAGRLAGLPTLYTVLGHPTFDQLPPGLLTRRLFVSAARRANVTAVLSRASAEALRSTVGRRAIVLPPGVRADRFPPNTTPRTGAPTILLSASLSDPRKRASLALEAFALLRGRRPGARLVLSGAGDPEPLLAPIAPDVRAAVETPGVGSPEEIPIRYQQATVTLLPADHEAFGLALVESLASGTPVVCVPSGGMPEIVEPGVGKVAASSSAEAIAGALQEVIDLAGDPATPPRCVERSRRWDWQETVGPAHLEAYRQLAECRPDRRRGRPGGQ